MKILSHNFSNALYHIMEGWRQVFIRMGHEWRWMRPNEAPLDVFNEYEPDLFIGTTYDLSRALHKAIAARPNMKVVMKANNYGPLEVDTNLYPIGVATSAELDAVRLLKEETGRPDFVFNFYHLNRYPETMSYWKNILDVSLVEGLPAADIFTYRPVTPRHELECDIAFVGGYWPYKAQNLDKYIIPLCYPVGKYNIKIFGNQPWPVPQYLGMTDNATVASLFASATICPNISEPHANVFGFEVNERVFKLAASKAFIINDKIASLTEDIFKNNEIVVADSPEHFQDLVHMFTVNPQLRNTFIESAYKTVMGAHTYCHRVSNLCEALGWKNEAEKALALLENVDG